ncbi:MAG TPA: hypothetical protein VF921_10950 [Vicinamibacterales bacterium]
MKTRRLLATIAALVVGSTMLFAQLGSPDRTNKKIPKPLQSRFVTGDPLWRELPVRSDFQTQYDRVWQTSVNTILEHNFDIATMDKDSGYFRTIQNERIVKMDTNWTYKIQISVKLVSTAGDSRANPPKLPLVEKVRLQVAGEVTNVDRKGLVRLNFLGYDQVLLQSLFQDLQAKLGGV